MKYSFAFALLLCASSLFALTKYKKQFTLYRQSPMSANCKSVSLNGIFYSEKENKWGPEFFYLYSDGRCYFTTFGGFNQSINDHDVDSLKKLEKYLRTAASYTGVWGHYVLHEDSIKLQLLYPTYRESINKWYMTEYAGKIIDDTTISLVKSVCRWCKGNLMGYERAAMLPYKPVYMYRLIHSDFKPDSSKAWFTTKKWYQETAWFNKR